MRFGRLSAALVGAAMLSLSAFASRADSGTPANLISTGDFDFYVLTLSWSPGFCDSGGARKSSDQCAPGAGEGFVVHGLWPDNASRDDPQDCGSAGYVSGEALAQTRGVYPNEGLARYEYAKHGTCSGLSPENYFAAVKFIRDQFAIPDMLRAPHEAIRASPAEIENAFIAANANLTPANMAVTCGRGELIDVRFCVSKRLNAFVNCTKVSGHSCHSQSITVAPLR